MAIPTPPRVKTISLPEIKRTGLGIVAVRPNDVVTKYGNEKIYEYDAWVV